MMRREWLLGKNREGGGGGAGRGEEGKVQSKEGEGGEVRGTLGSRPEDGKRGVGRVRRRIVEREEEGCKLEGRGVGVKLVN